MQLKRKPACHLVNYVAVSASSIYPKHGVQRCCSSESSAGSASGNWVSCSAVATIARSSMLYDRVSGTTGSLSTRCHHSGKLYYSEKVRGPNSYADIHPTNRRRKYVLKETETYKIIKVRMKVMDTDPKRMWTILRVHLNGTIHVLRNESWMEIEDTDVSFRQQTQLRYITWGSTREIRSYRCASYVPRMRVGDRFKIYGEPENNGWYEMVDYMHSGGGVRARRILPDYTSAAMSRLDRISNTPWTE